MNLYDLDTEDRLRLMRFVCSFAWADLKVAPPERAFVARMVRQLELSADELSQVEGWLAVPPPPEDIDPTEVPREHRQIFLNAALDMVGADGVVDSREIETFTLFERLLGA